MRRELSSDRIQFRSIEQEQLETIHKHQNTDCMEDVSDFLETDFPWAPLTQDQIKTKIEEFQKKDRTTLFAIYSKEDEFIGMAFYSARWDTWSPHFAVLVWPEHRRKGFGTEAARLLLEASFNRYYAHVVCCAMPNYDDRAIAFAESLGFKAQGASRRSGLMNGEFFDHVHMDILKDEYLALRSKGGEG